MKGARDALVVSIRPQKTRVDIYDDVANQLKIATDLTIGESERGALTTRLAAAVVAVADSLSRRLAVAIARTDKLPQAILAKAFRGELVPTEAELARAEGRDYEPASALLERIRNERDAAGPTAARGRKKAAPEKAPAKSKRSAAP